MEYCSIPSQIQNEVVYLQTSVAIDVFTDVLLVSIPIRLLWNLQMPLKKKVMLGSILSLSVFMVIIAIIRTTMAPLPNGVLDTSWIVFWQGMEAVVAVLMVSLTAFRGLFGDTVAKRSARKKGASAETPLFNASAENGSKQKSAKKRHSLYDEENIRLTDVESRNSKRDTWDVEQGAKGTCVTTISVG